MANKKLKTIKFPGLNDTYTIPQDTGDLTNGAGFISSYTETDPTVPSWAKASTKPTYTAAEVGALPDTTVIPAAQVNSNWTATTGVASILNKPTSMTPTAHASTATTYGAGSSTNYGHVKLSDATNSTSGVAGGIAATPAAVKAVMDAIPAAQVNSDWNATTGVSSILNKPTIPSAQVNANWTATTGVASILNKPSTMTPTAHASSATTYGIGTSANYGHVKLSDSVTSTSSAASGVAATPAAVKSVMDAIPTKVSELTNDSGYITGYTETDPTVPAWAKAASKPTYAASEISGLAAVATTGSYNSLSDKPTIPAAQVNSNWTATTGVASILNKPSIPSSAADVGAVPTSRTINGKTLDSNITLSASDVGALPSTTIIPAAQVNSDWSASTGVASILNKPTNVSTFTNDAGYITGYTETDPVYSASAAASISAADITNWNGKSDQMCWYGTCDTTASTSAKVVTCSGFSLKVGAIIGILFSTANTAATPTLNVNGTGAVSIIIGGSTPNSTTNVLKWSASTTAFFMYNGTYWRLISIQTGAASAQPRGAATWYGTSSTAATTQAKSVTCTNYVLTTGSLITVAFSTANTYVSAKITMNVNSTGAKDVYVNRAVTSSTNTLLWNANDILTFMYNGTGYVFIGKAIDEIPQELPAVTSSDNGKVLMVVNGAWAAASLPIYEGESTFTPAATGESF